MSAELLGMALMGPVEDPAAARRAREQLRRTSLGTAISAVQAVCEFSLAQLDRRGRRPHRGGGHGPGPHRSGQPSAPAGPRDPGASVHQVDADHAVCVARPQLFTQALLQACWSVTAARGAQAQPGLTGTAL